ncbi:MAG TPA: uroporphyrinogen decarboxylase [Nitrospirae bacterium]|nr:uroporphyrinogen decarboxylase [bacterium BMS3Abin10]GBE38498.1 uroporphyrinogen decarboxylase [bacterium BMS3Bbin08]HDH51171.1 uroporphyrinogen decarboxylase [Nitrospirota bacterium]HDK17728.1 uroporphyrinogen decarboxylase [Nitrospirota bacterium]HDK82320.1 uroporphyrinogen decarboxylase [Nitrospirota bacterium]
MNDTFLKACRGEAVPYTPVWIMRQAGRYLKQYQKIRKKVDFLTLCKTPELAAEVTIQPIDALGVDAAILFSDILIPVEAMGMKLKFLEKKGPVLTPPVRNETALKKLSVPQPETDMGFVMETIKILRKELATRVPLIGFSGAPFTTATYMIEGGTSKNFLHTKRMIFESPALYASLMSKVTTTVLEYLKAQIKAGAQAVQLFDTWAGIFSPLDYREYVFPYVREVIKSLKSWQAAENIRVPVIYFVGSCSGLLEEMRTCGADVIGIDWRINIDDAIKRLDSDLSVQGNLDPCALFMPKEKIQYRVKDILKRASSARGHIFNLGHGVLPETSAENVASMVEMVHSFSR